MKKDESRFLNVRQVAEIMQTSESSAYRIISKLNNELKSQDKIVIAGKISKRYFEEKVYI